MGATIWFKRQDDRLADDDDRSLLLREADRLDAMAEEAGVTKLSEFFDHTDAYANIAEEELGDDWAETHETWHDASQLIVTLEILNVGLNDAHGTPPFGEPTRAVIAEEIRGCLIKATAAKADGAKVHLGVVI